MEASPGQAAEGGTATSAGAGARLIAHLDQVLLKTFLIISLSDRECRGNKPLTFWNAKVVVSAPHSQAVISGSCAAVLPVNEGAQGGGAFEVGMCLGSTDSQCPTVCCDTSQWISCFLFVSALIVNNVCLAKSGGGRKKHLCSAAPRIWQPVLVPSPIQEGCWDAGEDTVMGYWEVQWPKAHSQKGHFEGSGLIYSGDNKANWETNRILQLLAWDLQRTWILTLPPIVTDDGHTLKARSLTVATREKDLCWEGCKALEQVAHRGSQPSIPRDIEASGT